MKKCPFCGKEYPDDVERCLIGNELLSGGEPQSSPAGEKIAATVTPSPVVALTDRQMRTVELVLVCVIAFGGYILASWFRSIPGNSTSSGPENSAYGIYEWGSSFLHEVSALGLLWYVLMRRGKSFLDLGLNWARTDIGWSVVLSIGGSIAFYAVYEAIFISGLTTKSGEASSAYVGHMLFSGGVSLMTILFQFLNPFFEELIGRAYVMTEIKALTHSATKAIIISTALQMGYHFYQGVPLAFADGAMFLIFSIFYAKTNRIAPVILAHLYADAGVTLSYLFRQ